MILLQIANTSATLSHQHIIMGMIGISIGLLVFVIWVTMKMMKKKNAEIKLMQQQHTAKIDMLRKEHSDTLEKIRLEMLKREEERTRQWMESEKETLHVLNGVSTLLDLSDKLDKSNSDKILKKLEEIQTKVEKLTVTD